MRRTLPLFAITSLLLLAQPPASAAEGGVIIPQVDPQPDEGYIDVWYHECPLTGSSPCEHHHVGRIEIPCVDPWAEAQPLGRAAAGNCDETLVDETVTVCVPTVTHSVTLAAVSFTLSHCAFGTLGDTVCLPNPSANPSDLSVIYYTPDCQQAFEEPAGPWMSVTSPGPNQYQVNYWEECDYRLTSTRCSTSPDQSYCVQAAASPAPTPTYAVGFCQSPVTGCLTAQASPTTDPVTWSVGPCGSPQTGSQCVPRASHTASLASVGVALTCGGGTLYQDAWCLPNPSVNPSDLSVTHYDLDCNQQFDEPAGPWASVTSPGPNQYQVNYWEECDYRLTATRCSTSPDQAYCVTAQATPSVPDKAVTVTTGFCDNPIRRTVQAPCVVASVQPDPDLRGASYAVGECANPISDRVELPDDLPSAPGPWVQAGSGGKYPATLWVELYTDCTHDLDQPGRPTCEGAPFVVPLGPFP